jgi:hypothetical protein
MSERTITNRAYIPISTDIILARYEENINWIDALKQKFRVFVYNKGSQLNIPNYPIHKIETLQNTGREPHTYLYHIITNYDELANRNVFLQGNPIPHNTTIVEQLNSLDRFSEEISFRAFTERSLITFADGDPYHYNLFCNKFRSIIPEIPDKWFFDQGGCFLVSKDTIRLNPLDFYKQLYYFCNKDPDAPWIMERIWRWVFIKR